VSEEFFGSVEGGAAWDSVLLAAGWGAGAEFGAVSFRGALSWNLSLNRKDNTAINRISTLTAPTIRLIFHSVIILDAEAGDSPAVSGGVYLTLITMFFESVIGFIDYTLSKTIVSVLSLLF
jgi:hypothetical protein